VIIDAVGIAMAGRLAQALGRFRGQPVADPCDPRRSDAEVVSELGFDQLSRCPPAEHMRRRSMRALSLLVRRVLSRGQHEALEDGR
jgi:hypothetical protein